MEEWLHFVETHSAYVFRSKALPPNLQAMWDILVQIVDHYCRPGPGKGTRESAKKGAALSAKFGKLMEENGFPFQHYTFNFHLVACRYVQYCMRNTYLEEHFTACAIRYIQHRMMYERKE